MLESETRIFLNLPDGSQQHILHPARIKKAGERGYTAELEEPDPFLRPGLDLFVLYYLKDRFVKQPARLDSVMQTGPTPLVSFQTTGEPMSAETRESFRVSTVMANLTAAVGAETECPLLDISTTGFAVEATQRYELGHVVSVTEDRASDGDLQKGQQHISAAIEREQLRRLSRSG
jgi:hypothetical protein